MKTENKKLEEKNHELEIENYQLSKENTYLKEKIKIENLLKNKKELKQEGFSDFMIDIIKYNENEYKNLYSLIKLYKDENKIDLRNLCCNEKDLQCLKESGNKDFRLIKAYILKYLLKNPTILAGQNLLKEIGIL